MIGLLCKDQLTIWSGYRKNFILLVLLYSAMAFTMDTPFMLFALLFVGGMYTTSTLVFDEQSHWDAYVRTLPVSSGQIVGAKYLLALVWMGGLFVLAEFLLTLCDLFKGRLRENLVYNLSGCLVTLGLVMAYYALSYLLSYKIGAVRARSGVILAIALIVAIALVSSKALEGVSASSSSLLPMMDETTVLFLLTGGSLGIGLVLFGISWKISTLIYTKKEY